MYNRNMCIGTYVDEKKNRYNKSFWTLKLYIVQLIYLHKFNSPIKTSL